MDKLDPGLKISLQESFGDLKTTLNESITKLDPRNEYTVLVAGKIMINPFIQNLPRAVNFTREFMNLFKPTRHRTN